MPYNIQGSTILLGTEPFLHDDRPYIPLRDVVEALGGNLAFEGDGHVAHAKIGPWDATVTAGEETVPVSGNGTTIPVTLTAAPYENEGDFFVPFDFLSEAYGYEVDFVGDTLNIVNPNAR